MSDDYVEDEAPPSPVEPPQQLVDFVGAFTNDQARNVFGDASVRLHDYLTQRQIADDNRAAADRLVSNIGQFKNGLASMVYNDPAATTLGLDLVPDIMDGLASVNPFLPDDQRDMVYSGLTTDIQQEIARTGVMSLAEKDAAAARALLANERVSELLPDRDRLALEGHIAAMDMARTVDADASARQRAEDTARLTNNSMVKYLSALSDPATDSLQFPGGWAQRVMLDPSLPPVQTAAMLDVYNRVKEGDGETDWYTFADMTNRIANGQSVALPEVFNQIGRGLKVADASTLARGAVDSIAPPVQREFRQLDATIQAARGVLAPPEYGIAGQRAFERFMGWLVPQYRAAGPGSLHPASQTYLLPVGDGAASFWNNFAPRLEDLLIDQNRARPQTNERPPLDTLFGRARTMAARG